MAEVEFTIYGDPIGQGRPKFARKGKFVQTYDPKPSRDYKAWVKLMASNVRPHKPFSGALAIDLIIYRMIPKSTTKKKLEAIKEGYLRPTVKPDVDNVFKAVTDAMTGIIYQDDKQIVDVHISKYYSDTPRAEVKIRELDVIP